MALDTLVFVGVDGCVVVGVFVGSYSGDDGGPRPDWAECRMEGSVLGDGFVFVFVFCITKVMEIESAR